MNNNELPLSMQGPLDTILKVAKERIKYDLILLAPRDISPMHGHRKIKRIVKDILEPYGIKVRKVRCIFNEHGHLKDVEIKYQFKSLTFDIPLETI